MNSLKLRHWAGIVLGLSLTLFFVYHSSQYFRDVSFLGAILLLEIIIAGEPRTRSGDKTDRLASSSHSGMSLDKLAPVIIDGDAARGDVVGRVAVPTPSERERTQWIGLGHPARLLEAFAHSRRTEAIFELARLALWSEAEQHLSRLDFD